MSDANGKSVLLYKVVGVVVVPLTLIFFSRCARVGFREPHKSDVYSSEPRRRPIKGASLWLLSVFLPCSRFKRRPVVVSAVLPFTLLLIDAVSKTYTKRCFRSSRRVVHNTKNVRWERDDCPVSLYSSLLSLSLSPSLCLLEIGCKF